MRLVALAVVPLVAVAFLATERIADERTAASDAADLVETVKLQETVAAVFAPAQLERITLTGLAEIDTVGIPREFVVGMSGFDLESIDAENLMELERSLDALNSEYRLLELADGTLAGDRLGRIRGALQTQRDLSDDRRATVPDVQHVFDELDALLADMLSAGNPSGDATSTLDQNRAQLNALADVVISGGERALSLVEEIFLIDPEGWPVARADARHSTLVEVFIGTLGPDERARFAEVFAEAGEGVAPVSRADVMPEPESLTLEPTVVRTAADSIGQQWIYLAALEDYSHGFHERVAAQVRQASADASADADRTVVLLWVIVGVTFGLVALVLWSMLVPLRRLTTRAAALSEGEIDLPPLEVEGPRDVRALAGTMNDVIATLDRVNHRIQRLASGAVDETTSEVDPPGAIGISLRQSVQHLAEVTGRLHRSEALSSAIVAEADDAIWTTDEDGIVQSANAASSRLTGLSVDEQCGFPITDLLSQTEGEGQVLRESGPQPKVLVGRNTIDVAGERITVVIAHDISERSRFEERLAHQALHDALTGLPNRFAVLEHLADISREHPGQVAVLYMDLDGFKSINDVRGHSVGDRVLSDVAIRLQRAVRNGEFVGRLGGDEFVVATHRFSQDADLIALGYRLIREIEMPLGDEGALFSLSASVGVAVPAAGTSAIDMIGQADNAVYQAKERGRGRVEIFDAAMQERMDREAELEEALRSAVRNDELIVHLQPMTDLDNDRVSAAEALVRWMRPGHGMVPPGDFIPVAERSSLILEIERWVLTRVCERLAEWKRREPDCVPRIAVNISGRHLTEGDLLADIDAVLDMTGADPALLELELTETRLLEDMDRTKLVFNELRERGITIAIDDFGTGYSSMTYLCELPIDAIKIDRSFVSQATELGYDATVIEALLTIGRTLDLVVVAEGVETEEQLEYVRARGCNLAQGFLLARPMPIDDAEAFMFGTPAVPEHCGSTTV